jgi:hypothetical protein
LIIGVGSVGIAWSDDLLSDDDLLGDSDAGAHLSDLPGMTAPKQPSGKGDESSDATVDTADKAHSALFMENNYPSASTCGMCHPNHFEQWSASPHAYAQLSPVSGAMSATLNILTQGTLGDFCIRCHSPAAGNLGEPIIMSNLDRQPASREGITCVVCHRVDKPYGKVNGRLAMVKGGITDPVYGPSGNERLKEALNNPDVRVSTDPNEKGRKIHGDVVKVDYMSSSGFCSPCHDVSLVNGFRAEETFSEYRHSPAAKKGNSCQDCHMATVPGVPSPYSNGPAAVVGGVATKPRKLTNHMFAGPDYSVVHPGIFPHNMQAQRMATLAEWLSFNHEAGWGTPAFEKHIPADAKFPERWSSIDDRYEARAIIDEQMKLLDEAADYRRQLLKVGYRLGEVKVNQADEEGIDFAVRVWNGTDGHNAPTGFERVVFLRVTVTDAEGTEIYHSGDLDPNGDLRDQHSAYVQSGEVPLDENLFNMQSKFIVRNLRGGEREQVLPANFSIDALPFIRPDVNPTSLINRTLGVRFHKKGMEPNGDRWAHYCIDDELLTGKPPYQAKVELVAGMIPANLVGWIQIGGFDYGLSPREVARRIVQGHQTLWTKITPLVPGVDGKEAK